MDSPWSTCKAELGCSAAFLTTQTVLQSREPAWRATWVMTTSHHNMDLEKMRKTTPWWRLTKPSKASWTSWSMIASRKWQGWWTNWVERCGRSGRKAQTKACRKKPNHRKHGGTLSADSREASGPDCWADVNYGPADREDEPEPPMGRQWTDGVLRKSERGKRHHLKSVTCWVWCLASGSSAYSLKHTWLHLSKDSNKGDAKVKQMTCGVVATVIFRNILISGRGESHFRICSCVHLHVSHVVVHMTQHKSSSVHQDEFWGACGSRKIRRNSERNVPADICQVQRAKLAIQKNGWCTPMARAAVPKQSHEVEIILVQTDSFVMWALDGLQGVMQVVASHWAPPAAIIWNHSKFQLSVFAW